MVFFAFGDEDDADDDDGDGGAVGEEGEAVFDEGMAAACAGDDDSE